MKTKVIHIDPKKIKLLELNARYMRHEVFARLVDNLRKDGELTQIPFGALWKYYSEDDEIQRDEDGDPIYEVLSGNHRVQAAIEAGLEQIQMQVTDEPLTPNQRRAIQLSHNAIAGEDDPATLKVIYDSIDDVNLRVYTGLDDKTLDLLDEVRIGSLSEANLSFQTVSMTFLPDELEKVEEVWEDVESEVVGSKAVWMARWKAYDRFMDAIDLASRSYGVKNVATVLMIVLDVFYRHLGDLREGWLGNDGKPLKKSIQAVPLETVIGDYGIPADAAAKLERVVQVMLSRAEIAGDERWRALEILAEAYIEGRIVERLEG